jgi:hypothetical protein
MRAAVLVCALVACGDNIVPPDSGVTRFDCKVPATGTHRLFLAFDGVDLVDAGTADARYDMAAFVEVNIAMVPAWRFGDPNRAAMIEDITCRLRESLFPYDIQVTRTRPPVTEDFEMVVFGGTARTDLGKAVDLPSVIDSDCANANRRDVAWVAEYVSDPGQKQSVEATAALAAAMFGAGNGLVPSKDPTNCTCMAGAATGCDVTLACAFSEFALLRSTDDFCQTGKQAQDQKSVLVGRYGARF